MLKLFAKPFAIFLITAFVLIPLGSDALAAGKDPSAGAMIADTVFARPLGLATTIAGSAVFIFTIEVLNKERTDIIFWKIRIIGVKIKRTDVTKSILKIEKAASAPAPKKNIDFVIC